MILNSPIISGSLTVTGNIITSGSITISGSIASASYASNAELLDGLDSTVFTLTSSFAAFTSSLNSFSASQNSFTASILAQTASLNAFSASILSYTASQNILNGTYTLTSSFNAQTASFTAFTASILAQTASLNAFSASVLTFTGSASTRLGALESYTSSLNAKTASFATTGSNIFIGTQTITGSVLQSGSFTTTGTIIAQTINVQTVTSSIVYSSGSNIFGNLLGDSQTFTGSVLITGSLTSTGATCFVGNTTVSTAGNTVLTINGTSGVPALSFTNTGGTNNIYGGVGSVANITLAPGDVNAVKVFAAGCVSCFVGAITANGGLIIAGSPTGYPLGELQFNLTTNNSYSGISTLGTGTTTLYFDHRATSNTGNFVFRNGTAAANTLLTIAGSGAITATNTINVEQSNSAASTQMVITNTSNASTTTKTSQLLFKISDTAGTQKNSAYVQAIPDGVNVLSAHLAFGTRLSDSDSNEKMRITAGGNVGIGITTPCYKMTLRGESNTYATSPSIAFYDSIVTTNARNWMVGAISTDYGSFNIASSTSQGGVPETSRLTINKDGNVGIGTTTPCQTLEVNGSILASVNGKIGFRYSSGDGNYYSYLRSATASGIGPIVLAGGFESGGATNEAIRFVTNGNPGERCAVSILNNGKFGIGTIAPSTQFQVRKNYWQFWDERAHGANVALFTIGIPAFGAAIVQVAGSRYSPGSDNYIGFSTIYIRTNNVGAIQAFSCDSGTYQPSYYISGNSVNFCSPYVGSSTNYTGISVSVQASGHSGGSEAAVTVTLL